MTLPLPKTNILFGSTLSCSGPERKFRGNLIFLKMVKRWSFSVSGRVDANLKVQLLVWQIRVNENNFKCKSQGYFWDNFSLQESFWKC